MINKKNIQSAERNITVIKGQINNEVYMQTLIATNITNINNTCDTILINKKYINNAEGNISII